MSEDIRIINFQKAPAYASARAAHNRRNNNLLDALELQRLAVNAAPEKREARMELASIYAEMGCARQSDREVLRLLGEGDGSAECWYGLGINRLTEGENDAAEACFTEASKCPDYKDFEERVEDAMDEVFGRRYAETDVPRKELRRRNMIERAGRCIASGESRKAVFLMERAIDLASGCDAERILLAMAYAANGEGKKADDILASFSPDSVQLFCAAAQTYRLMGRDADVRKTLLKAADFAGASDPSERELLGSMLAEAGMHERAAEVFRLVLQDSPYKLPVLHRRAVALLKSGAEPGRALACWKRILRVDPNNQTAEFFAACLETGRLDKYEFGYRFELPVREAERRERALMKLLPDATDADEKKWEKSKAKRKLLAWGIESGRPAATRAALLILACMKGAFSEELLREAFYYNRMSGQTKYETLLVLHRRKRDIGALLAPLRRPGNGLSEEKALIEALPVPDRRIILAANDTLDIEYNMPMLPVLCGAWAGYRRKGPRTGQVMRNSADASAALAGFCMQALGVDLRKARFMRVFKTNRRRTFYYMRRILRTNGGDGNGKD